MAGAMTSHPEGRFFNAGGFMPPMTTYAQNFEDVTLRRALQDVECGFYVDVGACHPTELSVTRWFYDQGWRGINIEPNPHFLRLLEAERPRDINLGVAVSDKTERTILHVVSDTGLSTVDHNLAESLSVTQRITVDAVPLDTLLASHEPLPTIDFLKIDAEGIETKIIAATALTTYRPRIILAESPPDGIASYTIKLQTCGYHFVWFDGLNAFYVRDEDIWRAELVARPPSVWDNATRFVPQEQPSPERRVNANGGWLEALRSRLAFPASP